MSKFKVPFTELRLRKFKVFDRGKERLRQSMQIKEDLEWFSLFHTASVVDNTQIVEAGQIAKDDFAKAANEIDKHRLATVAFIINPWAVSGIRRWERDTIDEVARIEIRRVGHLGNLFGSTFYVTTLIGRDAGTKASYAYCVASPEFLGWYPIYADAEIVPADRGDDALLGLSCWQFSGMLVHNTWAVSRIKFIAT